MNHSHLDRALVHYLLPGIFPDLERIAPESFPRDEIYPWAGEGRICVRSDGIFLEPIELCGAESFRPKILSSAELELLIPLTNSYLLAIPRNSSDPNLDLVDYAQRGLYLVRTPNIKPPLQSKLTSEQLQHWYDQITTQSNPAPESKN